MSCNTFYFGDAETPELWTTEIDLSWLPDTVQSPVFEERTSYTQEYLPPSQWPSFADGSSEVQKYSTGEESDSDRYRFVGQDPSIKSESCSWTPKTGFPADALTRKEVCIFLSGDECPKHR